ncbi:hypothetical protein [Niabella drilacis]|uniref:Uncharacterized protein n=1 Tax=Niabella drilacis (strain DSM 25811 / CCM 8410 / CCUG 62505 / LMG 26954 / E90) TaxID=1285928 RepID=A0A1G6VLI2_NIADE|nr:hypothetical protein [Niabella drilacis]SDD54439.1 hypothetical protein SAMN04487894_11071 [Niabella drilacis]
MKNIALPVCFSWLSLHIVPGRGSGNSPEARRAAVRSMPDITGVWMTRDIPGPVPLLEFREKDTAIYYSRGDTVLYFLYRAEPDKIVLRTPDGQRSYNDPILVLSDTVLVTGSVAGIKGRHAFFKSSP